MPLLTYHQGKEHGNCVIFIFGFYLIVKILCNEFYLKNLLFWVSVLYNLRIYQRIYTELFLKFLCFVF
jgi:hypothetical protein